MFRPQAFGVIFSSPDSINVKLINLLSAFRDKVLKKIFENQHLSTSDCPPTTRYQLPSWASRPQVLTATLPNAAKELLRIDLMLLDLEVQNMTNTPKKGPFGHPSWSKRCILAVWLRLQKMIQNSANKIEIHEKHKTQSCLWQIFDFRMLIEMIDALVVATSILSRLRQKLHLTNHPQHGNSTHYLALFLLPLHSRPWAPHVQSS